MVPETMAVVVAVVKRKAHTVEQIDGLENREAVGPSATQIEGLARAWVLEKFEKQRGDIAGRGAGRGPAFPRSRRSYRACR